MPCAEEELLRLGRRLEFLHLAFSSSRRSVRIFSSIVQISLALFLAVQQVDVVLHADELRLAMEAGGIDRLGELPGRHGAGTDVAGGTGFSRRPLPRPFGKTRFEILPEARHLLALDVA